LLRSDLLRPRVAQLGFFFLAFASATLIAKAIGSGWGQAATFGQMAFAAALVYVLLTDEPSPR
jgi:hypothetical protein